MKNDSFTFRTAILHSSFFVLHLQNKDTTMFLWYVRYGPLLRSDVRICLYFNPLSRGNPLKKPYLYIKKRTHNS